MALAENLGILLFPPYTGLLTCLEIHHIRLYISFSYSRDCEGCHPFCLDAGLSFSGFLSLTSSMNLLPCIRQTNLLKTSLLPHYLWCSYSFQGPGFHLHLWRRHVSTFPGLAPPEPIPPQGLFIPMSSRWMALSTASLPSGLSVSSSEAYPHRCPTHLGLTQPLFPGSSLPSLKLKSECCVLTSVLPTEVLFCNCF